MKIYVPDYYKEFRCIADKCRHNCCIGWEIDIDDDTYNKYTNVKGEFGEKLKNHISCSGNVHFCLDTNERCPFLNENNLCEIIINLGEENLCQICSDHPRYKNYFEDRIEIGLGLCCEAASELIIGRKEKTELVKLTDDTCYPTPEEKDFFELRSRILSIIQNRDIPLKKRIESVIKEYNLFIPGYSFNEWADIFKNLERLDSTWDERLHKLSGLDKIPDEYYNGKWAIYGEQLLVYFMYRSLPDGIYDESFYERLAFSIISHMIIIAVCASSGESIFEVARQYSSEIEYSEDNIDSILDILY